MPSSAGTLKMGIFKTLCFTRRAGACSCRKCGTDKSVPYMDGARSKQLVGSIMPSSAWNGTMCGTFPAKNVTKKAGIEPRLYFIRICYICVILRRGATKDLVSRHNIYERFFGRASLKMTRLCAAVFKLWSVLSKGGRLDFCRDRGIHKGNVTKNLIIGEQFCNTTTKTIP